MPLKFVPAEVTHPVFAVCLAQLRRKNGAGEAAPSAWVWDDSENQRFVLEDLFFQLLTGEPPYAVRMTAHSFLFNRAPQAEPSQPQCAMVAHWNAKAQAHGLGPEAMLDAAALVACSEWSFAKHRAVPDLLGVVPVVLSVCAQWHLQDSEFRTFAGALVGSLPPPGPTAGSGLAGWQPSRHSALPFIAAYVASRFPGIATRVHKGVSQAVFGMLFDPEFRLNLVYSLDLPVRIVDVVAQTPIAAREMVRVFGMAADNRWNKSAAAPPCAALPDADDPFLDADDDLYAEALVPPERGDGPDEAEAEAGGEATTGAVVTTAPGDDPLLAGSDGESSQDTDASSCVETDPDVGGSDDDF